MRSADMRFHGASEYLSYDQGWTGPGVKDGLVVKAGLRGTTNRAGCRVLDALREAVRLKADGLTRNASEFERRYINSFVVTTFIKRRRQEFFESTISIDNTARGHRSQPITKLVLCSARIDNIKVTMQVFGFTLLVFLEQAAQSIWRSSVRIQLIELGHDPMLQLELNQ
jgi:hypothetical protein